MSAYLPPGVAEWMIPGNRLKDEVADANMLALEDAVAEAVAEGWLPEGTDACDLLRDLEDAEAELWGESPDIIARHAVEHYLDRIAARGDDEDEADED